MKSQSLKKAVLLVFALILSLPTGLSSVKSIDAQEELAKHTTILLLGIDTGSHGRIDQGRSDVLMVLDLNPTFNEGVLASIPRDSYVNIPAYGMDKINHAYAFGGADLSMATVNDWLGTEIDNYISVNMAGLAEIVDAVGEIRVVPPTTFSIGEYTFVEGQETILDGQAALAYARERYTSGGDYARQARQRDIVQAVIQEAMSIKSLLNFVTIFSSLSGNIDTNMSLPNLFQVFVDFRAMEDSIINFQLSGYGQMYDGIYYEVINEDELFYLRELLQK